MPHKKPGLSLEDYRKLGKALALVHDTLTEATVLIGNAYPLSFEPTKRLHKVLADLYSSRSKLEDAMIREHPHADWKQVYLNLDLPPRGTRGDLDLPKQGSVAVSR